MASLFQQALDRATKASSESRRDRKTQTTIATDDLRLLVMGIEGMREARDNPEAVARQ